MYVQYMDQWYTITLIMVSQRVWVQIPGILYKTFYWLMSFSSAHIILCGNIIPLPVYIGICMPYALIMPQSTDGQIVAKM